MKLKKGDLVMYNYHRKADRDPSLQPMPKYGCIGIILKCISYDSRGILYNVYWSPGYLRPHERVVLDKLNK